jgi:hypothetical protein
MIVALILTTIIQKKRKLGGWAERQGDTQTKNLEYRGIQGQEWTPSMDDICATLREEIQLKKTEEEVDEIMDATRKSETFFTEDFEIV